MNKRDIINFLFVIGFPIYGIGTYVSAVKSPSMGYMISIFPHILIIIFYFIDLLYRRKFEIRVNFYYGIMMLFLVSTIVSLFIALNQGLPEATMLIMATKGIMIIVPFHAFIFVVLYNSDDEGRLVKLTLKGLSYLLAINLVGFFGLHLTNEVHSLEGRINFPFLDGLYSGACLLAIINLLLLKFIRDPWTHPIRFASLLLYFFFNLVLFYYINSRLTMLIFLVLIAMSFMKILRAKGVFAVSMFTIPILLSSGLILYDILTTPVFASVFQRVDVEDVTTFNGRSFLWEDAMDWLKYDQRGLLFGNGYKGHYFLDLISDVAKLWNEENTHHMHLHSTTLEILIGQGLVFYLFYVLIFYQIYIYFKKKHKEGSDEGAFFIVTLFLLFVMQVDMFVYFDSLGFMVLSFLASRAVVTSKVDVKAGVRTRSNRTSLQMPEIASIANRLN
jgi:hypothetical protein